MDPKKNVDKKRNMDIVTKMSIFGGVGLICFLIVIGILYVNLNKNNNEKNASKPSVTIDSPNNEVAKEYVRALAVIKKVDVEKNQIVVFDIEHNEEVILSVDGAVDIKDEYATLLTLAQLDMGDMVDVKYEKVSLRPEYVHITAQVWERKNVQNLIIDTENMTIQIDNDVYKYTEDMVTSFAGAYYNLQDLNPVDEVTVKGYKDTAWSISLENRHGFITLKNHEKFVGGTIEIGKLTFDITQDTKITVPVGVHSIIVAKEGMTSFITQVLVEEDQEVLVDVGQALPEFSMVSFNVSESGVTVYINDVAYTDFSEPVKLDFGVYTVKAEKNSFVSYESQLVVNTAEMVVDITMDQQPTYLHIDNPVESELYIDGNYIGVIPLETPIDPGVYGIIVRKTGFLTKTYSITIEDNGKDSYFTFPDLVEVPVEESDPTVPADPPVEGETTTNP